MDEKDKYLPCGNEMVSIPELRENDGSILSVSLLHMGFKGMVEIRGCAGSPLFVPYIMMDGENVDFGSLSWNREKYWVPHFTGDSALKAEGIILTPVGERGFIYRLQVTNNTGSEREFILGIKGSWDKAMQAINERKDIDARKYAYYSGWNKGPIFDLRSDRCIFSFAPLLEDGGNYEFEEKNGAIDFSISKRRRLKDKEVFYQNFYWGFGYEEVGAAAAAIDMKRKTWEIEYSNTINWLDKRVRAAGDPLLDQVMNTNLFFNFFYSSGITLDTEEFVLVTSRSPRYYVSAAYWDRDSLLWSFPSILLADKAYAKEMLDYVFSKQIKNIGIHSRYIDGTVLEPGFELDELCAPIIALKNYIDASGDISYLSECIVVKGIDRILSILESKKHPAIDLYETFLQPTDDMNTYPYLTYDNVLVYKMLNDVSYIFKALCRDKEAFEYMEKAQKVKAAILENCIINHNNRLIFAWSLDLKGSYNVYDEPPGSLELLPFYGFCGYDDEVYKNTVEVIRDKSYEFSFAGCSIDEIGCAHAPHPWILSLCNSLLCGRKPHGRDILARTNMDNGVACESVDENTGECTTGGAFATCAGFLAYAIYTAFH